MKRMACFISLAALLAFPLSAYEYPFSDTAVREAYFLGAANNEHTKTFLAQYTHFLPMPPSGPHVVSVALETPYVQMVEYASSALNFTAVDAAEKFLHGPNEFRVRVQIDLTASYTGFTSSDAAGAHLRSGDFWQDFPITLIQGGHAIPQRRIAGEPVYSSASDGGSSMLAGALVTVEYSGKRITSDPATVEIQTPDGQRVQSEFDLSQLK